MTAVFTKVRKSHNISRLVVVTAFIGDPNLYLVDRYARRNIRRTLHCFLIVVAEEMTQEEMPVLVVVITRDVELRHLCTALAAHRLSLAVLLAAILTGAVCGFLIDIACGKLTGYNAVLLAFFSIIVSLLYEYYLRNKFVNYIVITAVISYIQCWLDYKFYYEMWEYENVEMIFSQISMKVWAITIIASVFVYLVIELINRFFLPKDHITIEEAVNTAIRSERK